MGSKAKFYSTLIGVLGIFISAITGVLIFLISDQFYKDLGSALTYKGLINIIFVLFLLLFFIIFYYKSKEDDNNSLKKSKEYVSNELSEKPPVIVEQDDEEQYFHFKRLLAHLPQDEKKVLREYLNQNTRTVSYKSTNRAIIALEDSGVISQSSQSMQQGRISYTMTRLCWRLLNEYPNYLN